MKGRYKHNHQKIKPDRLETLWDDLLSRQPERVRAAFDILDPISREAVISHLGRMVSEDGWMPEQRQSAQAALQALQDLMDTGEK